MLWRMWTCSRCGESVEDSFNACWKCGTSSEGVPNPEFQAVESPAADPIACPRCSRALDYVGRNAKVAAESGVPVFGICLGHQVLAMGMGGSTYKLPFGHRGTNHPVKHLETGKVEITSQNHGFAVDPASLPKDVEVTHLNLYDHTVEGLKHKELPVFCVQYHPEAAPGPHDADYLFGMFLDSIDGKKQ